MALSWTIASAIASVQRIPERSIRSLMRFLQAPSTGPLAMGLHFPKVFSSRVLYLIAGQCARCQYAAILFIRICLLDLPLILHRILLAFAKHLCRRSNSDKF